MSSPLHEDDPANVVVMPDGRVVRNLTAEEYAATYASGTVHGTEAADATLRGEQ